MELPVWSFQDSLMSYLYHRSVCVRVCVCVRVLDSVRVFIVLILMSMT